MSIITKDFMRLLIILFIIGMAGLVLAAIGIIMQFAHGYSDDHCVVYTDEHLLISRVPIYVGALADRIVTNHVCIKVLGEIMDNGWTPFSIAKKTEDCFGYNIVNVGGCVFFWRK